MPSRRPPRRLYFAYGSNLSFRQMANRCPSSTFLGRAILPDHCWQINTRGYANVFACPGFAVHGLVYELGRSGDDEARLDIAEGVHSGAYEKAYKDVVVYPAAAGRQVKSYKAAAELDRVAEMRERVGDYDFWSGRGGPARVEEEVLVYLSPVFVGQGTAHEEYVGRMNIGIRDAVAMGVPADYFDNVVRSSIPQRPVPAVLPLEVRTPRLPGRARSGCVSYIVDEQRTRPPVTVATPVWQDSRPRSVSFGARTGGAGLALGPVAGWETENRRRSWTPQPAVVYDTRQAVEERNGYRVIQVDRW
ncbi:hypothetical protein C8A05DRAFT_39409 [Staphylotrichum tortipilum]|uniref:gamma-glutamylcyclotransferase n=1 Tax=Staphylotrichum tortipilum TaxID=2831512 RepID=A0AAN6MBG2_9PEZI|nr:hypothetical protein C8A05DRAFT_39409 [Staphylotrichum longicolle]